MTADNTVDIRIMFPIGKAAEEMNYSQEEAVIWQSIPLNVSGKNIFFDRDITQKK